MNNTVIFTGGGTAGHVTPNIAIIKSMQQRGWQVGYIGSRDGIEYDLINELNIPFYSIRCGKLRRYFSWRNFTDPFNIIIGIMQAMVILIKHRPRVVFSKGGFVAFPVVFAAWLLRIPVVAHESDLTPGLANRLSYPFVKTICLTFEAGKKYFKHNKKCFFTGTPLREELFAGEADKGFALCGFKQKRKTLLFIGGGQGAQTINRVVRDALQPLLQHYNVIHLCGRGKLANDIKLPGYCQFDYVNEQLPDLFALSDLVISRAGANSVCEILALQKPHIFIPLPLSASRGDQIDNANYFHQLGMSEVLHEELLTPESLLNAIEKLDQQQQHYVQKMQQSPMPSGTEQIIQLIEQAATTSQLGLTPRDQ